VESARERRASDTNTDGVSEGAGKRTAHPQKDRRLTGVFQPGRGLSEGDVDKGGTMQMVQGACVVVGELDRVCGGAWCTVRKSQFVLVRAREIQYQCCPRCGV
jgi:hypothetical protein